MTSTERGEVIPFERAGIGHVERLNGIIASPETPKSARLLAETVRELVIAGHEISKISVLDLIRHAPISSSSIERYKPYIMGRTNCLPPKQVICPATLRKRVREAFDYTCQYCGLRAHPGEQERIQLSPGVTALTDGWMSVDRIIPGAHGGKYEPSNVTLACATCNTLKSDTDAPIGIRSLADIERCGGANA